jgi:hypothetical protein
MEYVSIKNQLIQIENFMKTLDKSKKILVDNAANNGVVNPFELHQLTEKHHKLCRMPKEVRED